VTTLAFLAAPFFGYLNFRLILSEHTPKEARPSWGMVALSWLGLLYLVVLGAMYLFADWF